MALYQNGIDQLRSRLDEKGTSRFWDDADLLYWLVEGCTNVARRTETLIEYDTSIPAVAQQADYALASNVLRVHRIEFIPESTLNPPQVYPLQPSSYYEMDQRWGASQFIQSVYPSWFVLRGTPGNPLGETSGALVFKVYPVPSQDGAFNVFYYAMPAQSPASTDTFAVQAGYENLPILYAESVALRSDRDPRWQESRQLYEGDLMEMIEMTRRLHDQAGSMAWSGIGGTGYGGGWTYDGMFGGGF